MTSQQMGYDDSESRPEIVHAVGDDNPPPLIKAVANGDEDFRKLLIKISDERVRQAKDGGPEPYVSDVGLTEFMKWNQLGFDNVIVINKAPDVQALDVYRADGVHHFKVSTGQEHWVCNRMRGEGGVDKMRWEQVWTGTPTGYYQTRVCDADHRSGQFDDAKMTHLCFFNGGIGTHQGNISRGNASHGCTRMDAAGAKQVFEWNVLSGMDFAGNERMFRGHCPPTENISDAECERRPEVIAATKRFEAEALAIKAKGAQMKGRDGSSLPYVDKPTLPVVNADGTIGQGASSSNYRTLYIVKCVTKKGVNCAKNTQSKQPPMMNPASLQETCQAREEAEAARQHRAPLPRPSELGNDPQIIQAQSNPYQQPSLPPNPLKALGDFFGIPSPLSPQPMRTR